MNKIVFILTLLLSGAFSLFGQTSADGQFGNATYNGDDFISVRIPYSYKFNGTRMHIYYDEITIGSYKRMTAQLQAALAKEGIRFPMQLGPNQVSFTLSGIVDFGPSHLRGNKYTINFAGGTKSDYSHIQPSTEVEQYASEYYKKYQRNFYTAESKFSPAFVKVSGFVARDLLQKIQSMEAQLKREEGLAANNNKQLEAQLQRAQLLANEGNIAGAEGALRQAKTMAGNDQAMLEKLRSAEQMVANRKTQQQQSAKKEQVTQQGAASGAQDYGQQAGRSSSEPPPAASNSPSSGGAVSRSQNPQPSRESQQQREAQQQLARVYQQMEENRRNAESLESARQETSREWSNGNYIQGSSSWATELAKQGNAAGAYTAIGTGVAMQVGSLFAEGRARKQAAREAAAAREAEREAERAEKARMEKQRVDMILRTRASVLEEYTNSKAIPLSTSKETANRIYYFLYDVNAGDNQRERTTIYVSNVFEIGRFNDGTWPYQSAVDNEINKLTPYGNRVMHGYYTSKEDAEQMRKLFVEQMGQYGGATIQEVAYKGKPAAASMTTASGTASSSHANGASSSLGIPIGPIKGAQPKEQAKQKDHESSLGIPIKMKKQPF